MRQSRDIKRMDSARWKSRLQRKGANRLSELTWCSKKKRKTVCSALTRWSFSWRPVKIHKIVINVVKLHRRGSLALCYRVPGVPSGVWRGQRQITTQARSECSASQWGGCSHAHHADAHSTQFTKMAFGCLCWWTRVSRASQGFACLDWPRLKTEQWQPRAACGGSCSLTWE